MGRLTGIKIELNHGQLSHINAKWLIDTIEQHRKTIEQQQQKIEMLEGSVEYWKNASDRFRKAAFILMQEDDRP